MVELAETIAERAPRRVADQLHQPGRHGHRGASSRCSATAWSASATRRRRCAGASPARSATARRDVVRLLRPQPPRLAAGGLTTPTATGCRSCSPTTSARRLRGGAPVRRRLAARARDDPERVPLLLLLPRRRGRRRSAERASRAAPSCSSRRPRSTPRTARTRRRARPPGAPPATSATAPTWRPSGSPPASRPTTTTAATAAATRARRWRVVEAIANNTRAIMILNTANRSALPFLDERAVVEVPCIVGRTGPVPVAVGADPAARAGARHRDQGRRAHDDRGGADRLGRARGARARAAPAGAERRSVARDIFDGYRARLPELQERFAG